MTRIYEITNFTFYSTKELFFFNNTFRAYFSSIDMSEFQQVYIAYLRTREDFHWAMLNKAENMRYLPNRHDSFNYEEQRGYDFVKHCNQTAYAGFLDTIDDNLRKANEMGQEDNVVFMKGSDNFRPTTEFVIFDPHLDGIMAHRLQRLIDTGVHFIWEKWIAIRSRKTKKSVLDHSRRKPVQLNSDMLSLLLMVLVLFVFAGLICCAEIVLMLLLLRWNYEGLQFFRSFIHVY